MKTLHAHLLGRFSLTCDNTPFTTLKTPRLQALFAFLILHRSEPQFRYHLAFTFWPDSREAQARTNLRNLVHLLRQALPNYDGFICSDSQTLQWREDSPFTLDVHDFERALTATPGSGLSRQQLESAVQLYQGDLLPDCYEDWVIPKRESLRRAYLAALEALAVMAEDSRELRTALDYTRRLV